ncbi:isoflavone 7-O-methyltransferase-like [Vigna unguiculata]|uniref:isoflavone 7-O-methyltransferase-like n=1 Tax=Vigna unguiculata TaxID=3917 RepID=UPI001016C6BF|nr:isoflavone 7-O-methyltransferase-like [Vigna unguiculata]
MVVGAVAGGRAKSKRWWAALVRRWCFSRRKKMKLGGNYIIRCWEGVKPIVDVGGGTRTTAKAVSDAFPNVKCIVFDRPQVVENLSGTNNLRYVGGDMLESIPKADVVLLKLILHDWNDEDCNKILENCKEAIFGKGKRGKVILIETVINEGQDEHGLTRLKLAMDVRMTCLLNGKERSEEEWKKLFMEPEFQSYKIYPLTRYLSLNTEVIVMHLVVSSLNVWIE